MQAANSSQIKDTTSETTKIFQCSDCGKIFSGENAFTDAYEHLNSTDGLEEECTEFHDVQEWGYWSRRGLNQ